MTASPHTTFRVSSMLDLLTEDQMAELRLLTDQESESPTVSERLAEMMAVAGEGHKETLNATQTVKASADDKFATLLATPLHELAKNTFDDDDSELNAIMQAS